MSKFFRILSIDGGGIRGIMPAIIISELEKRLRLSTGKPDSYISDYFDMIAGTSTGGMLACYYLYNNDGNRLDAVNAIDMYEKHGATIFKTRLLRRIIQYIFDPLYHENGINKVLKETFGDVKLSEAPCNSTIMAYDITARKAVIFTSETARNKESRNYYLRDIARATSAAPTYFRVAKTKAMNGDCSYLIDGGIYANDPTLCAIVEAKKTKYPDRDECPKIKDMYVVSLGTGEIKEPYKYKKAKHWGRFCWILPLIDMLLSSGSEVVSFQVKKLFEAENSKSNYKRIVPKLINVNDEMDDASPKNIANLKSVAEQYIANNSNKLDEIVKQLIR